MSSKLGIYIDTSCHLVLGLFDSNKNNRPLFWIDYLHIPSGKSATVIHEHLYQLLQKNNKTIEEIDILWQAAGPGSYTGMRISHGITDVLTLFNKKKFAFYHFEVPYYQGFPEGFWISRAFKGEYFIYGWKTKKDDCNSKSTLQTTSNLFSKKDLLAFLQTSSLPPIFTHFNSDLDLKNVGSEFEENISKKIEIIETSDLIYTSPQRLLDAVLSNGESTNKKPYYYRSLEKEFRISF